MPTTIHGTNGITFNDGSTQNTRPAVGFRNRIINGDMGIDQRNAGASFTVPNSSGYGSCDRWASLSGATSTWTMRQVSSGNASFPSALQVGRNSGSTSTSAIYIGQVIETTNCQDLAGSSVTLSFYARAGANFSSTSNLLGVEIWTGSGSDQGWTSLNSATWATQVQTLFNYAALTTSYQRFTYTATIPSTTNEIAIRFSYSATGTAGANDWFQITGVQLEAGPTATDFERMPIGTELELCQRYFEKAFFAESRYGIDGIITRIPAYYKVEKRATPTITLITAPDILFYTPNNSIDTYSAAALGGVASTLGCRFTYTIRGTRLYAFGVTQPAIYGCDSEL